MKSTTLVLVLVLALAASADHCMKADSCQDVLNATLIWNPSCNNLPYNHSDPKSASCWSPARAPVDTDILYFPPQSYVTIVDSSHAPYKAIIVDSIVVDFFATVVMNASGIATKRCFVVNGNVILQSGVIAQSGTIGESYPPDPSVPVESCSSHPGGFTPRICGPGIVYVHGALTVVNYYSSLWAPTVVAHSGTVSIGGAGYMWSNITNFGNLLFQQLNYMQGEINNCGNLAFSDVQFAVVDDNKDLIINNYGSFDVSTTTHTQPGVTVTIYNYGSTTFWGTSLEWISTVHNIGNVTFMDGWIQMSTTLYNAGFFIANQATVFASAYHSLNGTLVTLNGGQFFFGSGSGQPKIDSNLLFCLDVARKDAPAEMPQHPSPPDLAAIEERKLLRMSKRTQHNVGDEGYVITSTCSSACGSMGCTVYIDSEFCNPYTGLEQQIREKEKKLLAAHHMEMNEWVPPEHLFIQRYNCFATKPSLETSSRKFLQALSEIHGRVPTQTTRRFTLGPGRIMGDGTGSILSTDPVGATGDIVISNTKWVALSEFGQSITEGGGRIVVDNGGKLVLGLDSSLSGAGKIVVNNGGIVHVPKHSNLRIGNFTMAVQNGGTFRVDGRVSFDYRSTFTQCGDVFGTGETVKEDRQSEFGLCHKK